MICNAPAVLDATRFGKLYAISCVKLRTVAKGLLYSCHNSDGTVASGTLFIE